MKHADIINGIMLSSDIEALSISAILYLCRPFPVTETNIRTFFSRNIKNGYYEVSKKGRKAYYRPGKKLIKISGNVVKSFKAPDWSGWNNDWWGISYSASDNSSLRYKIRKKLLFYRFGSLNSGYWVRPVCESEHIENEFTFYRENGYLQLMRVSFIDNLKKEKAAEVWNLDKKSEKYLDCIKYLEKLGTEIENLNPELAFRKRIETGNKIIPILCDDPLLPEKLLPEDWPINRLRKIFFDADRKLKNSAMEFINKCPDRDS